MKKFIYLLPVILAFSCTEPGTGTEKKEPETMAAHEADPALNDLFEIVNVVKMHLFAARMAEPSADYPYLGKPIPAGMMTLLSESLLPEGAKPVYACYYTENSHHYILRVPGKNDTWDLVLARWDKDAGKLVKASHLCYYICEDGSCQQQDSWLADLDDNRLLELIVRVQVKDANGNVTEDQFDVLTDSGAGVFGKTSSELASLALKENYVMNP